MFNFIKKIFTVESNTPKNWFIDWIDENGEVIRRLVETIEVDAIEQIMYDKGEKHCYWRNMDGIEFDSFSGEYLNRKEKKMFKVIYEREVLGFANSYEEAEELATNELGFFDGSELFLEETDENEKED